MDDQAAHDNLQARDNLTPMMRQYREHKQRHPDAVLLFRMGDFYEMFFEDAKKASGILDIALTTRDKNKEEAVPMCGFPHHAASGYISRLLAAGERVAVCDQMEDPKKAKGIVRRDVTRVLTPGLTEEPSTIKGDENHFVVALVNHGNEVGLAAFDLSTGELKATATGDHALAAHEIRRLDPKEVLIPDGLSDHHTIRSMLDESFHVQTFDDWMLEPRSCVETICDQWEVQGVEGFGLTEGSPLTAAVGGLLAYVRQTRPETPLHIKPPRVYNLGNYMILDHASLRNLEIFKNLKDGSTTGTLVKLMDRCVTPMGARLLRQWMSYPLMDLPEIHRRSQSVHALVENSILRRDLQAILKEIGDMERISGRISLKSATPRDLAQLRFSAEKLPGLISLLVGIDADFLAAIAEMDDLSYVAHAIAQVLVDAPPASLKDGGLVRPGYDAELDELRSISRSGREWIAAIEARERERTGIPNLKVGYNKVFGYYIEVTRSRQNQVPPEYIRKQTLVNAERFVTEDLKEYELKILNSQERSQELEEEIFYRLREKLLEVIPRIQQSSAAVASLDVIVGLADVSHARDYVRPAVIPGPEILVKDGRHPVVETFDNTQTYVPNDVLLNRSENQILLITGPNMAGKSTYLRQTALLVIMAQMGCMVPAREASIGLVDRIFTRIGAADYLAFGQSTFMVEMNETADILHNATDRSLVLLVEVGRGTSTFDGLSIAWAVTEYLHDRPDGGPRTLFATHYHELVEIASRKDRVKNYNVAVKEWEDRVVFLRKIVPGSCSRSYGIQVARLAGIPDPVITRAREVLAGLEGNQLNPAEAAGPTKKRGRSRKEPDHSGPVQPDLFSSPQDTILSELQSLDPNNLTPLDALNILARWKRIV